jgi:hypothetical protein
MRIIETKVYKYSELSERAQERARDWLREAQADDNYFAEYITDEFREALKALGFDVRERDIEWSGFSSQGDGASFTGAWYASQFAPGKLLADRPAESGGHACPANAELHRIAAELRALKAAGLARATVTTRGRGHFMYAADCECEDSDTEVTRAADDGVTMRFEDAARDLAHAFYKALEAEYTYQNSDEQIAESIEANEYEFTEEGERA